MRSCSLHTLSWWAHALSVWAHGVMGSPAPTKPCGAQDLHIHVAHFASLAAREGGR